MMSIERRRIRNAGRIRRWNFEHTVFIEELFDALVVGQLNRDKGISEAARNVQSRRYIDIEVAKPTYIVELKTIGPYSTWTSEFLPKLYRPPALHSGPRICAILGSVMRS